MITVDSVLTKDYNFSFLAKDAKVFIQVMKYGQIIADIYYTLEELKTISPYFQKFDKIQNVIEALMILNKEGKITCIEKDDRYEVNLLTNTQMIIILPISKNTNVSSTIPSDMIPMENITNRINGLEEHLKKALETVNMRIDGIACISEKAPNSVGNQEQNEQEIRNLQERLDVLEQKMESTIEMINTRFEKIESMCSKQMVLDIQQQFHEVNSLLKRDEMDMIYNWIAQGKVISLQLLYNPLKGQDNEKEAMKAFYNKGPLLVLVKTTKGIRFGGYTSVGWSEPPKTDYTRVADPNAFIFSIDLKKQYFVKESARYQAIHCLKGIVINFGYGLALDNHFMSSKNNGTNLINYGAGEPKYEHNNNEMHFTVENLFVYQILYC